MGEFFCPPGYDRGAALGGNGAESVRCGKGRVIGFACSEGAPGFVEVQQDLWVPKTYATRRYS